MAGKTRSEREKRRALGKGLKAMFRNFEQRPIPDAVRALVDQLEAPAPPVRRQARKA